MSAAGPAASAGAATAADGPPPSSWTPSAAGAPGGPPGRPSDGPPGAALGGAPTGPAAPAGPTHPAERPSGGALRSLRARLRRWRGTLAVVALVLLAAVTGLALLAPSGGAPLDPRDAGPQGGRALASVLADHGVDVRLRDRFADVQRDLGQGPATVLVARPDQLAPGRAADLRAAVLRGGSDLVLVTGQDDVLSGLGLPAQVRGEASGRVRQPGCADPVAGRAGAALTGGVVYGAGSAGGDGGTAPADQAAATAINGRRTTGQPSGHIIAGTTIGTTAGTTAGTTGRTAAALQRVTTSAACYPAPDGATLLVLHHPDGRTTTLLGSRQPLTNDRLADGGDAALGVGVLGRRPRLVWWTPRITDGAPGAARESVLDLVPDGVRFGLLQVVVVLAVVVLWRGRRLGRLVAEPLPVVVRAGEATRGRARLYRRARARGRAARVLRAAAVRRIALRCGLARTADPGAVALVVADRTGRSAADVHALLAGSEPADDASLVALAEALDALETEVRSS